VTVTTFGGPGYGVNSLSERQCCVTTPALEAPDFTHIQPLIEYRYAPVYFAGLIDDIETSITDSSRSPAREQQHHSSQSSGGFIQQI